jgi:hypothetical protein
VLTILLTAALFPVLPEPGSGYTCESHRFSGVCTDDPDLCEGWPVTLSTPGGGFPYTPTVFDINGDGADEIFSTGGHTFGLFGDGTFLPGWPSSEMVYMGYGTNDQMPGPSCADMTGSGLPAVLWSERDWYAGSAYMWSFNGRLPNGENLGFFPQQAPDEFSNALASPFVLGDADDDGDMEAWSAHTLGNTGDYYRISGFDHLGNRLFTRDLDPEEQILCLYFGDLQGDDQEVFIAVTLLEGTFRLFRFDSEGLPIPGYPVSLFTPGGGGLMFGPPILWDMDGDQDLEILLGYNIGSSSFVQAVHHDGTPVDGFPMNIATQSQLFYLCLGDVTGDQVAELVALDNHLGSTYRVHVLSLQTGQPLEGWPVSVPHWPKGFPGILDVDGDGFQDVVFVTEGGQLYAISGNGESLDGYPKEMTAPSISGVAAGDIDGDDLYELVAVTWNGWAYAWNTDGEASGADWPMRGVDSRNTGVFCGACGPQGIQATPEGDIFIHPSMNPVSGTVVFLITADIKGDLILYDACGRTITVLPVTDTGEVVWNPGVSYPAGIYFAELRSGSSSCTTRIVLLR